MSVKDWAKDQIPRAHEKGTLRSRSALKNMLIAEKPELEEKIRQIINELNYSSKLDRANLTVKRMSWEDILSLKPKSRLSQVAQSAASPRIDTSPSDTSSSPCRSSSKQSSRDSDASSRTSRGLQEEPTGAGTGQDERMRNTKIEGTLFRALPIRHASDYSWQTFTAHFQLHHPK